MDKFFVIRYDHHHILDGDVLRCDIAAMKVEGVPIIRQTAKMIYTDTWVHGRQQHRINADPIHTTPQQALAAETDSLTKELASAEERVRMLRQKLDYCRNWKE